jgi:hypothetical protein
VPACLLSASALGITKYTKPAKSQCVSEAHNFQLVVQQRVSNNPDAFGIRTGNRNSANGLKPASVRLSN